MIFPSACVSVCEVFHLMSCISQNEMIVLADYMNKHIGSRNVGCDGCMVVCSAISEDEKEVMRQKLIADFSEPANQVIQTQSLKTLMLQNTIMILTPWSIKNVPLYFGL